MNTVHELMSRASELPYGEARTVMVEDALRQAEGARDAVLAFRVRMELNTSYQYGGEPAKTFTTFSRCLADFDAEPGRFGADAGRRLLWHFKWIVNSLTKFPEVPLDRTYAVLDDMERRYRLGGRSLHAVYVRRAWVAQHLGDTEAADHWYALWHTAARDELSDCIGCDPSSKVGYLSWRGRDEDALAIAEPVLSEEFNCSEQPQDILTELLPVYLRTGRLEAARDAHRRSYRVLRTQLSDMSSIGDHLVFCARSGNEVRGLEILERHLGWLDRAPSPAADMWFSAAGALVLRRLIDTGHDDVVVRRPAHADRPAGPAAAAELLAELTGRALELGTRFDLRNGTTEQSRLVRDVLDARPLTAQLPLTPHARRPAAERAREHDLVAQDSVIPSPATADGWLDAAEQAWGAGDSVAAVAAWRRFDQFIAERDGRPNSSGPARPGDEAGPPPGIEPSAGLTLLQAGRRADGQGVQRIVGDDLEGALGEWRRAAELYAEAGEEERRQAALSRTGSLLCQSGREAEGLPLLEAAQSHLQANAIQRRRALAALLRLASAYAAVERAPQALALLDQAMPAGPDRPEPGAAATGTEAAAPSADPGAASDLGGARDLVDPGDIADVDLQRARVLLGMGGREADAVRSLQLACAGYRLAAQRAPLAQAALLLAQLLSGISDPSDDTAPAVIVELCTEAIVNAPADVPGLSAAAHAQRGGWLLSQGDNARAIEDLIEAVAAYTAMGAYPQAAYARKDLCVGYYNAGRHLEAAEVAEEAIPMFGELDDLQAARHCRFLLANAQRELGEREEAAETFTGLAGEEMVDNPVAAAEFLESAGDLLSELDKDALAATRFADAAQAHAAAGDPQGVLRSRRRQGLCLSWSGRAEAGLEAMGLAREALAELAELAGGEAAMLTWETALLCYDEARVYGALGRGDAAIADLDQAIEGFEALDEDAAAQTAKDQRASYTEGQGAGEGR